MKTIGIVLSVLILMHLSLFAQTNVKGYSPQPQMGSKEVYAKINGGITSPYTPSTEKMQKTAAQPLSVTLTPQKSIYSVGDTVAISWSGTTQSEKVTIDLWKNGAPVKNIVKAFIGATSYSYTFAEGEVGQNTSFVVTVDYSITSANIHTGKINSIDWSNDDAEILTTGDVTNRYTNATTLTPIFDQKLGYDSSGVRITVNSSDAQFHPLNKSNSVIASAIYQQYSWVQIWDWPRDNKIKVANGVRRDGKLVKVDFNFDGTSIVATTGDSIQMYSWSQIDDTTTQVTLQSNFPIRFGENGDIAYDAKFSPDNSKFIAVGYDYIATSIIPPNIGHPTWKLYNKNGSTLFVMPDFNIESSAIHSYESVAWNPFSTQFVTPFSVRSLIIDGTGKSGRGIEIWDAVTGKSIVRGYSDSIPIDDFPVNNSLQTDWSKDGKYIASVSTDGMIAIWNSKAVLLKKHLLGIPLTAVKFSNDSKSIAVGDASGNLYVIKNVPLFATGISHPDMTKSSSAFSVAMPSVTVTQSPLDFGSVEINGSSVTKTITIQNNGQVPVTLVSMSLSSSSGAFLVKSGAYNQPVTLAVGESKVIDIEFKPTQETTYSGSITFATKVGNPANITVSLTGKGFLQLPKFSVSTTEINFGDVEVSTQPPSRTITLSNDGNVPATFTNMILTSSGVFSVKSGEYSQAITLAVGENRVITLQFAPTTDTPYSGSITFTPKVGNPITVRLLGNGTIQRAIISVDLGNQLIFEKTACKVKTKDLQISNTGKRNLTITSITTTSPAFKIISGATNLIVLPNQSNTITIEYDPTKGSNQAQLIIANDAKNASNGNTTIQLVPQKGTVSFAFSQTEIDLGEICRDKDTSIQVTLIQQGTYNPQITVTGDINGTIAPQALSSNGIPFTIPLRFSQEGDILKTISATDDECQQTAQMRFKAKVGTPKLEVNKSSLGFISEIDTTIEEEITLVNKGTITAKGVIPSAITPFVIKNISIFPTDILVGGSLTVSVSYTPSKDGEMFSKTLTFSSQCGSPMDVSLKGSALSKDPEIIAGNLDFGDQLIDSASAPKTITIHNTSNKKTELVPSFVNTANSFRLPYPNPFVIQPNETITLPVVFTPNSAGTHHATLTLQRQGAPVRTQVQISGTGIVPDPSKDKIITVYMSDPEKHLVVAPKDNIEVLINVSREKVNEVLTAIAKESLTYKMGLQWNRRMLAFLGSEGTGNVSVQTDGGGVSITNGILYRNNESEPETILQKLRFEVLFGETDSVASIVFSDLFIERPTNTAGGVRLFPAVNDGLTFKYNPKCGSGEVRGTVWETSKSTITIIPNPATDFVTAVIEGGSSKDNTTLEVYSIYGAKIFESKFTGASTLLDFRGYSSGSYTVVARTPRGIERAIVNIQQ